MFPRFILDMAEATESFGREVVYPNFTRDGSGLRVFTACAGLQAYAGIVAVFRHSAQLSPTIIEMLRRLPEAEGFCRLSIVIDMAFTFRGFLSGINSR
jgi:hypothetical protein